MRRELDAVTKFYGNRKAERSGVPLINHIHEGLIVLSEISAWHSSYAIYCLHPLIQADADFNNGMKIINEIAGSPKIAALTVEYRSVANSWLSDKVMDNMMLMGQPKLSPHEAVNNALIADKVQNRADFELYHIQTHPRARQIDLYFRVWLDALGISEQRYSELVRAMKTRVSWKKTNGEKTVKTILRTEKSWAADANGRYGWVFKDFMSDGTIQWEVFEMIYVKILGYWMTSVVLMFGIVIIALLTHVDPTTPDGIRYVSAFSIPALLLVFAKMVKAIRKLGPM